MKKIIPFLLFLILSITTKAQPTFQSVKQFGDPTPSWYEDIQRVATDTSGNVYAVGSFQGTADFDPGPNVSNLTAIGTSSDIFITKFDASGNFIWAKKMGGNNFDAAFALVVDGAGDVIITGYFGGTADFDPGSNVYNLSSAGGEDIFICKLNASGNFVWAVAMGGPLNDDARSIATDASGNIYTTGYFYGTADFNPGASINNLTSAGDADIFVSKLSPLGNFIWAKNMGGTLEDRGNGIAVNATGDVFTTGYFNGVADFDPGISITNITSAGAQDIFISKLDAGGNAVWVKQIGGSDYDQANDLKLDATGNIFTTGYFESTVDFDPGSNVVSLTSALDDEFVLKLDGSGNYVWAKNMGGNDLTQGLSIALDATGNVYTTGNFGGTTDFDPGVGVANYTAGGTYDMFVHKLNPSGNYLWTAVFAGTGTSENECRGIALDASNNIYTVGYFYSVVDFNPGAGVDTFGANEQQIFIHKMSQCTPSTNSITQSACSVFQLNGQTYTSTGIYTQNLTNSSGCDSILTLNLTINTPNVGVSQNGTVLTASATGAVYQWIKCSPFTIIPGATLQNYTATTNGNYAVIVTQNTCSDTSECKTINSVGIQEIENSGLISISPNPASDILQIKLGETLHDASLIILDLTGRKIFERQHLNDNYLNIDISKEPLGVYFVEFILNQESTRLKFIKK